MSFEDFDSLKPDLSEEAQEWFDLCWETIENCSDVPERKEDFATSISEKLESMAEWIEDNNRVTDNMKAAIQNMHEAIERIRN